MRIYDITADCLVDNCLVHWYVKARNDKEAWIKGYLLALNSSIADDGTVDSRRLKGEKYEAILQSIKSQAIQLH